MWSACHASFCVGDTSQQFSQNKELINKKARRNNYKKKNRVEAGFGNKKKVQEIALGSSYIFKLRVNRLNHNQTDL